MAWKLLQIPLWGISHSPQRAHYKQIMTAKRNMLKDAHMPDTTPHHTTAEQSRPDRAETWSWLMQSSAGQAKPGTHTHAHTHTYAMQMHSWNLQLATGNWQRPQFTLDYKCSNKGEGRGGSRKPAEMTQNPHTKCVLPSMRLSAKVANSNRHTHTNTHIFTPVCVSSVLVFWWASLA